MEFTNDFNGSYNSNYSSNHLPMKIVTAFSMNDYVFIDNDRSIKANIIGLRAYGTHYEYSLSWITNGTEGQMFCDESRLSLAE